MKRPDSGANDTVMTSHNATSNSQKNDGFHAEHVGLYQKCLHCKDYGVSCNGPKLAALGDIMIVREFHRAIRDQRAIPMRLIYAAAEPISESTINDYFSHSEKDFKWTTVGCIDNALTAICGNRVGKPPMDHPCPASSTEIQAQIALFEGRIDSLQSQNSELQQKVTETKGKVIAARDEVKEDYASRVQFLKELCEKRQLTIDQMEEKHQKEIQRADALAADYLARIDEKNRRIDRMSRALKWVSIALAAALIALACYVVWDLMHPNVGFFIY